MSDSHLSISLPPHPALLLGGHLDSSFPPLPSFAARVRVLFASVIHELCSFIGSYCLARWSYTCQHLYPALLPLNGARAPRSVPTTRYCLLSKVVDCHLDHLGSLGTPQSWVRGNIQSGASLACQDPPLVALDRLDYLQVSLSVYTCTCRSNYAPVGQPVTVGQSPLVKMSVGQHAVGQ